MEFDLVFEGGGAKGMVFVGAMQEFTRQGHTVGRLLGTSAGAITATLLAAGYTDQEMLAALAETTPEGHSVFSEFMGKPGPFDREALKTGSMRQFLKELDIPFIPDGIESKLDEAIILWMSTNPTTRHLLSFVEDGGWYSADAFLKWISRKLDSGQLNGRARNFSKMNLKEFYQATGRDLSLVASDTTEGYMLVLNHRTAPNLPICWAVRMSMSIPLLWQEVVWQKSWGTYRDREMENHVIVDGGLLSNFPIELFLSSEKPVTDVMGAKTSDKVLGMLIDESQMVEGATIQAPAQPKKGVEVSELATVKRLMNLVNTMLEAHDKSTIYTFKEMVVRLPAGGYGTVEFDMTEERRSKLVEAGTRAMRQYLAGMEAVHFGIDTAPAPDEAAVNQVATGLLR